MAKKPGKRSVHWKKDPEILRRLVMVADMRLKGATYIEIATALEMSVGTAHADVKRCEQLWREEVSKKIDVERARAVAHLRLVQATSWASFRASKQRSTSGESAFLKVVKDCEAQIAALLGTEAPKRVRVSEDDLDQAIERELARLASGGEGRDAQAAEGAPGGDAED